MQSLNAFLNLFITLSKKIIDMEMLLLLAFTFLLTFLFGRVLEKIKIPWLFAALLLGVVLSPFQFFKSLLSTDSFQFLSQLGMLFLLFIIGFEMDLRDLRRRGRFVVEATFFIILFEALFGSLIVHYLFNYDWLVSILIAISFATVGEAILVPILEEHKIFRTKLGQTIINIGVFDDLVEVACLLIVSILVSRVGPNTIQQTSLSIFSIFIIFLLAYGLTKLKKKGFRFKIPNIETLFVFTISLFFLFIGIGKYADAAPIGAILAGVALKNFIPPQRLKLIESEIKTMCYGLFAPIFFLSIGISVDLMKVFSFLHLLVIVVVVVCLAKIVGSIIASVKKIGLRASFLLGLGLSTRFSTSLVILSILLSNGLIENRIYSILVSSTIIFAFIIPLLFSYLVGKWKKAIR